MINYSLKKYTGLRSCAIPRVLHLMQFLLMVEIDCCKK